MTKTATYHIYLEDRCIFKNLNEEEFKLGLSREMADLMFQRLENFQRGHKHLVGNFDLLWFNGRPVAEGEF